MISNFSKKEKLLIIVLLVLLIGLIYYRFIYVTVNDATASAKSQAEALQTELDAANVRLAKINSMKNVDAGVQRMGSYNSSKVETAFLNTVLAGAPDYAVSFDDVTRDGSLIRRNFQLRFTTPDYASAVKIVKDLSSGEFRCMVSDVRCTIGDGGQTTMDVSGTFYETMVGGTEDSALPKEGSESAEQ